MRYRPIMNYEMINHFRKSFGLETVKPYLTPEETEILMTEAQFDDEVRSLSIHRALKCRTVVSKTREVGDDYVKGSVEFSK